MKLHQITITNAFGQRGDRVAENLQPVHAIVGPNDAGKTTLLSVIDIVLRGPSGGVWPKLGSPDYPFMARLDFDGVRLSRGMRRGEHVVAVNGEPVGVREGKTQIDAMIGRGGIFRLDEFLGLTADKRLQWLEREVLDGGGDGDVAKWREANSKMIRELEDLLVPIVETDGDASPRSIVAQLLADVRTAYAARNKTAKELTAAIKAAEKADDQLDLPSGTVVSWRAEIERLQAERAEVMRRKGAADGAASSLAVLRTDIQRRQREHAELTQKIESIARGVAAANKDVVDARAAEAAARKRLDDAVKPDTTTDDGLSPEESVLQRLVDDAEAVLITVIGEHAPDADIEAQIVETFGHMNRLLEFVRNVMGAKRLLEHARDARAQRASVASNFDAASMAHTRAQQRLQQVEAASVEQVKLHKTAVARLAELGRSIAEMEASQAAVASGGGEAFADALAGIDAAIKDATRKADILSDHSGRVAERLRKESELADTIEQRDRCNDLIKRLNEALQKILQDSVGPLTGTLSALTRAALGRDAYVSVDGGVSVGLMVDGEQVPLPCLSESQQLVLSIALSVAFRARLGGWRSIVLDGAERLEQTRRTALVDALRQMHDAGLLDNAIIASVDDGWRIGDTSTTVLARQNGQPDA